MVGPGRLLVVLVVDGDVIEDVLPVSGGGREHPVQAVADHRAQLVGEGRVVGLAGRDGGGQHVAVAVLVLEPLARQGGPARGGAHQEAPGPGVGRGPDRIAHPLEAEHGVEGVEGNHRHPEVGVRGARRDPARQRPALGDALLEDLAVGGLRVRQQQVVVHRLVELAAGRVDAELPEQRVHAEGAGLVGDDRHHPGAEGRVAQQLPQQRREGHGGGHGPARRALVQVQERRLGGQRDGPAVPDHPLGHRAVQGPAALHHVAVLDRLGLGPVIGRDAVVEIALVDLVLHVQAGPQLQELGLGHLLDLVGGVAALEPRPQGPSLDGLGQDDRGLAPHLAGRLERRVHLLVVVAAPGQHLELVVGQVLHQLAQPGVGAEEVVPDVGPRLHRVALVLAVHGLGHLLEQHPVEVAQQQLVPLGAPDHLDDVPARPPEHPLQLLDDLGVAPHRPVQPLQVAVDHPFEVVEVVAAGQGDGPQGLGLVALAVAQKAPHGAALGVLDPAVVQVFVEAGVVDGVDGAQPHRHGGELPEVGHQPGMGVAGQPAAPHLHAEVVELVLAEAPLQVGPGVHAGGGVALEVDVVAGQAAVLAPEEVVEPHLVQRGRGGEGG